MRYHVHHALPPTLSSGDLPSTRLRRGRDDCPHLRRPRTESPPSDDKTGDHDLKTGWIRSREETDRLLAGRETCRESREDCGPGLRRRRRTCRWPIRQRGDACAEKQTRESRKRGEQNSASSFVSPSLSFFVLTFEKSSYPRSFRFRSSVESHCIFGIEMKLRDSDFRFPEIFPPSPAILRT